MGTILASADDLIDAVRGGIEPGDGLGSLGSKPEKTTDRRQSVRTGERSEFDGGKRTVVNKIDDRKRVVAAEAVVRDVGEAAVGGGSDLVRIWAHGDSGENAQRDWIDKRESARGFGEDE